MDLSIFNEQKQKRKKIEEKIYQKLPSLFKNKVSKEDKLIIYDVPLLFEKGLDKLVDLSVCVYAGQEIQIDRLVKRDQESREGALNILKAQMDIEEKKKLSDFVIDNTKTEQDLITEVESFVQEAMSES